MRGFFIKDIFCITKKNYNAFEKAHYYCILLSINESGDNLSILQFINIHSLKAVSFYKKNNTLTFFKKLKDLFVTKIKQKFTDFITSI